MSEFESRTLDDFSRLEQFYTSICYQLFNPPLFLELRWKLATVSLTRNEFSDSKGGNLGGFVHNKRNKAMECGCIYQYIWM